MPLIAITRAVSTSLGRCELTHQDRVAIDLDLAWHQHTHYEACLERLGCEVIRLPEEPGLPDAVFVEDTAVVLDEIAVITRPGAASRRPEVESVAAALAPHRKIRRIEAPGTVDGGDVLVVGRDVYVGRSSRTNDAGISQLRGLLGPIGYRVHAIEVTGCLHLKSAVTVVAENTLLLNPNWVDARAFGRHEILEIDPSEPHAANGLLIGETLVYPVTYSKTAARLASHGIPIEPIDLSELAKAEGAVTCCSLVFTVLS
jgi:dimethylargininase